MDSRVCGILAIASPSGIPVGLADRAIVAMRDKLAHRGPDASGLWRSRDRSVVLAHRRLAVVGADLSPTGSGSQPMVAGDGSAALIYNGELYNDHELRAALGLAPDVECDTPTVFALLREAARDQDPDAMLAALAKMRGMFAIAFYHAPSHRLVLARDPMGIKPLYWWPRESSSGPQLVVASEPTAILAHPDHSPRPDLITVSAYLSTIRTTLGERTLFAGVRAIRPGECMEFDLSPSAAHSGTIRHRSSLFWQPPETLLPRSEAGRASLDAWAELVRRSVSDSVAAHLRSDVPACVLLSGGLDSTIIASRCTAAVRAHDSAGAALGDRLRTYAAGAAESDSSQPEGDPHFARLAAEFLGSTHSEALIDRTLFNERWPELIERTGLPLSTPNQVAIHEIARRLRADGQIVALSGEGADELFGGYDLPMRQALEFERASAGNRHADPGGFHLASNAWIAPELKARLLQTEVWRALEADHALSTYYRDEFDACSASCASRDGGGGGGVERSGEADRLEAHLRFLRRINLTGLLERFDVCTMLEGVEGRTPFADVRVAELASAIPMRFKFRSPGAVRDERSTADHTKIVLRAAFAGSGNGHGDAVASAILDVILRRPKASFPLPFQEWLAEHAPIAERSLFLRELFTPEALRSIARDPGGTGNWGVAWPTINLALWARKWWG